MEWHIPSQWVRSGHGHNGHVCCPCTVLSMHRTLPVSAETIVLNKLFSHLLVVLRLCILFSDPCGFIVNTILTLVLEINFKAVVFSCHRFTVTKTVK